MLLVLQQYRHAVRRWGHITPVVLAIFLHHHAHGAAADGVTATLSVRAWLPQADGHARALPAEQARPGDLLEYKVVYRNASKGVVHRVEASLPIPQGTVYEVDDPRQDMAPMASLDGEHFEPTPLTRKVTLPNGQQQWQAVPLARYRHLRWPLGDLPAGKTATVTAKVRLVGGDLLASQPAAVRSKP